jgi:hypothetical protein
MLERLNAPSNPEPDIEGDAEWATLSLPQAVLQHDRERSWPASVVAQLTRNRSARSRPKVAIVSYRMCPNVPATSKLSHNGNVRQKVTQLDHV